VAKVAALGVPMMLIHGTADLNTPFEGYRLP
jgi:dipeptidyl aminopeptidase/acylaminoacyl peptidase